MAKGAGKPGRRRGSKWQQGHRPLNPGLTMPGGVEGGTVRRRDGEYHVRRISASGATKEYICPGCRLPIPPGTPHVVAWRADFILGDEHAAAERRHWHPHCWRIG